MASLRVSLTSGLLFTLLLGASALSGCGKTAQCKPGTLFLTVQASGAAASATTLNLTIAVGASQKKTSTRFTSGTGTIEVDFPSGYPIGQKVTITVDAIAGGMVVASGISSITLPASCADLTVTLGAPNPDLAIEVDGGVGGDMACIAVTSCPAATVCGKIDDGCGGKVDCGPCLLNAIYQPIANSADTVWLEGVFQSPATVNFPGGATATATVAGPNRLSATVPPGAGQGLVTVTANGATTTGLPFERASYTPAIGETFRVNYEQADYAKAMLQAPSVWWHSSVATDKFVWLFGGFGLKSVYQARINSDGSIGSFNAAGTLTTERTSSTAVRVGSWVYVIGGAGGTSPSSNNGLASVERAPINADGTLGTFADAGVSLMTNRWYHRSIVIGDYVYVFGGNSGPYCSPLLLKSIERARIKPNGDLGPFMDAGVSNVVSRVDSAVVVNGSYVYVIGGSSSVGVEVATIGPDGSLGGFSDAGGGWAPASILNGITAHVIGNTLYVFGGHGSAAIQTATFKSDGTLNNFGTITPTLPQGDQSGFTTHIIGNYIYAFGGGYEYLCGAATISKPEFNVKRAALITTGNLDTNWSMPSVALKSSRTPRLVAAGANVYAVGGQASGSAEIESTAVQADGTLGSFGNTTLALTTPRTGYSTVVAGDWLYVLGGATSGSAGGTTLTDVAPIATDGTIGAFVAAKYPLSTARANAVAFALTNLICIGSESSTLECAPLNSDGTLGAAFATVASVTVPTGVVYVAVLGSNVYAFGGGTAAMSAAPITGGGLNASTVGNFAAIAPTFSNQQHGSAFDVVGNTLWSFTGNGGLAFASNSIARSALDPVTQAPATSANASPFVTLYQETQPGTIVVGNLLYLVGGTNQGAAVPTTAVLLK
jgi:hypothetical protein